MKKTISVLSIVTMGILLMGAVHGLDVVPDSAANLEIGNASPEDMVVSIINWILGILALIAVVMILVGGFKWMTAGGNEEKTEGAKKLLIAALIGLVIILAAWGISVYVINNILDFTNATT